MAIVPPDIIWQCLEIFLVVVIRGREVLLALPNVLIPGILVNIVQNIAPNKELRGPKYQ
jgi:hypothetical protein